VKIVSLVKAPSVEAVRGKAWIDVVAKSRAVPKHTDVMFQSTYGCPGKKWGIGSSQLKLMRNCLERRGIVWFSDWLRWDLSIVTGISL
jgi:hypothetical protein